MKVEALYVCHFRNLKPQQIEPCAAINELVGNNAQGKTAILEALHALILGGSFRTYQLRELVQHSEKEFLIEAEVNSGGVHKTVSLRYDGSRRSVTIDGQLQESTSMLLGNLLGVTATLEDHDLIFGAPSVRRRFLDEQIAQIDPFYVSQLSRYSRALTARNRLLKMKDGRTIGAWEEQLAKAAAYIVHQRRQTVHLLAPKVIEAYRTLFPEERETSHFSMQYLTQCPTEEEASAWYQHQYAQRREQEMRATVTLVGPHRDDVEWTIDDRLCKTVASLGQARSVALALRCAEWLLLAERSKENPLFLIDDVESTLDATRKNVILQLCQQFGQVFVTCHTPQSSESRVFHVKAGACSVT
jgi:DNA replication and repair protein RecF